MNGMPTEPTEEHQLLLQTFTRFAEKELRPLADRHADGPILETQLVRDLFARLEHFGFIGGLVPPATAVRNSPCTSTGCSSRNWPAPGPISRWRRCSRLASPPA